MSNNIKYLFNYNFSKIVATVGPASRKIDTLKKMIKEGVSVFRINMAHATLEEHKENINMIRQVSKNLGRTVAILADLAGPKIRLAQLYQDKILCKTNEVFYLTKNPFAKNYNELTTSYPQIINDLKVNNLIMLADGTVTLKVTKIYTDKVKCVVVQPGIIRPKQGINLPYVNLNIKALTPIDKKNAIWACSNDIDYLGLSFVRTAQDIIELKKIIKNNTSEKYPIKVIAKIEKPEALDNLDKILEIADGIMVARGDLGIEMDISKLALTQKYIISMANKYRKPVIIATQMLDSMQHSKTPTRAEVSDVTNAIIDGADACMLSGETAIGEYPIESVKMMKQIIQQTESAYSHVINNTISPNLLSKNTNQITEATVFNAGQLAQTIKAKMLVVVTQSGYTALSISKNRHFVFTLSVSKYQRVLQQMNLYWAVIPLYVDESIIDNRPKLLKYVADWGRKIGFLKKHDKIVLIAGSGLSVTAHNIIMVHHLE